MNFAMLLSDVQKRRERVKGKTNLLRAAVLRSRLAVAVAVGVVLRRLLAVTTAPALLALVVVVLRGHAVCVFQVG